MEGFSGDQLLSLYANGRERGARVQRAMLTGAVLPETSAATRAGLPLGTVERALLRGLDALTGPHAPLDLVCNCPKCAETLEFQVSTQVFWSSGTDLPVAVTVPHGGTSYEVIMPTLGAMGAQGLDLTALSPEAPWDDPAFLVAVETALSEADPLLGPEIVLDCVACGHGFSMPVDFAALLWQQVANLAQPLTQEVIRLSKALGWSEKEILAMAPARRRLYLKELGV